MKKSSEKIPAILGMIIFGIIGFMIALVLFNRPNPDRILIESCYRRAQLNKHYKASREEIVQWIGWIKEYDTVIQNTELFCGKIDQESVWNPISREDDGTSFGLMNITVDAAKLTCEKHGIEVSNIARALYIPKFNIQIGVLYYTDLYSNYVADAHKLPMLIWNSGHGAAAAKVRSGKQIEGVHWNNVKERIWKIEGKTRSQPVKQKGSET